MYLSRLVLNRAKRDVQRDLGSLYELHRTLMRGFPDAAEGGAGRCDKTDAARVSKGPVS
ncbi:MAG: type I-E CRISPR-associated protein Cas6/Cse3/CasE [Planctomyces sp.]